MRAGLLVLALAAAACGDTDAARLAGIYQGSFEAVPVAASVVMRPEWSYRGFLQLYATGNRFKMRMESTAHVVDSEGTWSFDPSRNVVTLSIASTSFDDRGGELRRPPGLVPIEPREIQNAYGRHMPLRFDATAKTLTGLSISMGPITGKHVFIKGQG